MMPANKGLGDEFAGAIEGLEIKIRRNVFDEFDCATFTFLYQDMSSCELQSFGMNIGSVFK